MKTLVKPTEVKTLAGRAAKLEIIVPNAVTTQTGPPTISAVVPFAAVRGFLTEKPLQRPKRIRLSGGG